MTSMGRKKREPLRITSGSTALDNGARSSVAAAITQLSGCDHPRATAGGNPAFCIRVTELPSSISREKPSGLGKFSGRRKMPTFKPAA